MDNRVWEDNASASPPTAPITPSTGYPSDGDPAGGVEATTGGAFWFHQIGEELRAVIEAAGLTPDEADLTQLLASINALIVDAFDGANQSLLGSGYQKLPGGLIVQWGVCVATQAGGAITFPVAFPNAAFSLTVGSNSDSAYHPAWTGVPSLTGFTAWSDYAAGISASYVAFGK